MTKEKLFSLFLAAALGVTMTTSPAKALRGGIYERYGDSEMCGIDGNPPCEPSKPSPPTPKQLRAAEAMRVYNTKLVTLGKEFRGILAESNAAINLAKQGRANYEHQRRKYNAQVDVVNELKTSDTMKSYMPTREWLKDLTKKTAEFVDIYEKEFETKKALFDAHVTLPDDHVHVAVPVLLRERVDRSHLMSALRAVPRKNAGVTLHERFDPSHREFFGSYLTKLMNSLTEKVGAQAGVYTRTSDKLHKDLEKYLKARILKHDAREEGGPSFLPQDHSRSNYATHCVVWSFSDGVFLRKNGYVKGTSYVDVTPAPGHLLTWVEHTIVLLRLDYLSSAHTYHLAKNFRVLVQEGGKALQPVIANEENAWFKKTVLEKGKLDKEDKLLTKLSDKTKTSAADYKTKKKKMDDALKALNDHENKRKRPLTKLVSNLVPKDNIIMLASNSENKKGKKQYVPYHLPTVPEAHRPEILASSLYC